MERKFCLNSGKDTRVKFMASLKGREYFSTEEIVELLRIQKHDFLNHLQTISGFLQLGKSEKALYRVKAATHEIEKKGAIMLLRDSEASMTLLLKCCRAQKRQINAEIKTDTDMQNLELPGDLFVGFCKELWDITQAAVEREKIRNEREYQFNLGEKKDCYYILINIKPCSGHNITNLKIKLNSLVNDLRNLNYTVEFKIKTLDCQITQEIIVFLGKKGQG